MVEYTLTHPVGVSKYRHSLGTAYYFRGGGGGGSNWETRGSETFHTPLKTWLNFLSWQPFAPTFSIAQTSSSCLKTIPKHVVPPSPILPG